MRVSYLSVLVGILFASCSATGTEWAEPEPEELMEEDGYLQGGGVTIDWGPGAKSLLNEYSTLKEELIRVRQSLLSMEAEREGLEVSLEEARNELKEERSQRAQSDAESDSHRKTVRELEAKILSLSIRLAKVEQENLTLKIDKVTSSLENLRRTAPPEGATPTGIRR